VTVCLFLAGVATFALLYATQPLLPELVRHFTISEETSTLSVSAATLGLGLALLVAGPLSEAVGRTPIMKVSLLAASLLGVGAALASSWPLLLTLRLAQGVSLAGLPAVATAYLREEVAPGHVFRAVGLYIGGTAIGGMSGRLVAGFAGQWLGWRGALGCIAVLALVCAFVVWLWLPASRHFHPAPAGIAALVKRTWRVVADPGMLALYSISGTMMGGFVALYNATGFRLEAPPHELPLSLASLVFLAYAGGSVSSSVAGRQADRRGHGIVVLVSVGIALAGLAVTLIDRLLTIAVGLGILTVGFFAAHGVASAWTVARAQRLGGSTSQAASIYLFSYYLGSSVFGALAGTAWAWAGWSSVAAMVAALWLAALALACLLWRTPPAVRRS